MDKKFEVMAVGFIYLDMMTLERLRKAASRVGDWLGYNLWDTTIKAKYAAHDAAPDDAPSDTKQQIRSEGEPVNEAELANDAILRCGPDCEYWLVVPHTNNHGQCGIYDGIKKIGETCQYHERA